MKLAIALTITVATAAEAAPLSSTIAPGVTIDWQRGVIVADGVGPADRNAPSPTVARVGAERTADRNARARLAAALAVVPMVGGPIDAKLPAIMRELALAPVVATVRGTDGSVRVSVALGIEAVRQSIDGPRPVVGVELSAAPLVIDAQALAIAPMVGWSVSNGRQRWRGPITFVAEAPVGAIAITASRVAGGQLVIAGALPSPGAAVIVVVPKDP